MTEKLDLFGKVLLSTSTINYMASSLNVVNEQYRAALVSENIDLAESELSRNALEKLVTEQDNRLDELVRALAEIVRELGNYLNKKDCICAIDARIYRVPSEILLQGKDEVDNTYDDNAVWKTQFNVQ